MFSVIKQRILRLVDRAGYVVTKVADHQQHEQLISAELARRAERVAELEKVRAALTEELDLQRDRALVAERKLSEADREFRLGRERDARELEAARAETWSLRVLAAELQQQLDRIQQGQGHDNPSNHNSNVGRSAGEGGRCPEGRRLV